MLRNATVALLLVGFTWGCGGGESSKPKSSAGGTSGSGASGGTASGGSVSNGGSVSSGGTNGGTSSSGAAGGTVGAGGGAATSCDTAVAEVPPASWENVTGTLAGMASECGNAAQIYASPYKDLLVTGVARIGLFGSTDGAATWTPIGAGGPSTILNRMIVILFDPENHDTFWESGIYGWESPWSEGAFVTTDSGASFQGFANMGAEKQSSNDSISVDFTDPDRKTMLSGGHEQSVSGGQGMFLSKNSGSSFDDIMPDLPAGLGYCTNTLVIDANTLLIGCATDTRAIIRSTDAGATWSSVSSAGGVGQPLLSSDGTIYWSAPGGGMLKSTDDGASFDMVADNSKAGGSAPIELPDGRIASTANGVVMVSADQGVTWTAATTAIPFSPNGFTYSACRRAFYASHFDCSNSVPGDAHARFGWDYTAN